MKLLLGLFLLAAAVTCSTPSARAQTHSQKETQPKTQPRDVSKTDAPEAGDDEVLSVTTSLVSVPSTVKDERGGYVVDLKEGEFHVYEGGVEQRIAHFGGVEEPISVVLLIDVSCSIERLEDTKAALLSFIDQMRPADSVLPIAFGRNVYALLTESTRDRAVLRERILGLPDGKQIPCDNATRLFDAVNFVVNNVVKNRAGRGAVILLADGGDSMLSKPGTAAATLRAASQLSVPIYSLRLVRKYDPRHDGHFAGFPGTPLAERARLIFEGRDAENYIEDLASFSGGRYFRSARGEELKKFLTQVGEELRHQYTLAYYPPPAPKGEPQSRKIKVRVDRKRASVRARDSYVYLPRAR